MVAASSVFLVVASLALAGLAAALCIEIAAAFLPPCAPTGSWRARRGTCAVLVPAHDEALVIRETLEKLRSQLKRGDRILVVADNCSDDTAVIAASAGAEVVERFEARNRGKSFALDFGLQRLALAPPEVVVAVDADCELTQGSLDRLVSLCLATGRPVQACYVIAAPEGASASTRLAEFAQIVKNRLRPRGLQALGQPCQLQGSGMAFPWNVASAIDFRNGSIVEDLQLGLDFAAAGHPPLYCDDAQVVSLFPASRNASASQRKRWLQGHLQTMAGSIRGLARAVLSRSLPLAVLTLDLCVPPLTLLVALLAVTAAAGVGVALLGGSWTAAAVSTSALLALAAALTAAWRAAETPGLRISEFRSLASYFLERALLYPTFLTRRPAQWVRTDRGER